MFDVQKGQRSAAGEPLRVAPAPAGSELPAYCPYHVIQMLVCRANQATLERNIRSKISYSSTAPSTWLIWKILLRKGARQQESFPTLVVGEPPH